MTEFVAFERIGFRETIEGPAGGVKEFHNYLAHGLGSRVDFQAMSRELDGNSGQCSPLRRSIDYDMSI